MGLNKRKVGIAHEEQALQFLLKRGWKLLEKNYSCKLGEVDLICLDPADSIVFVEVKYRSSLKYGFPQAAVTTRKTEHIVRAALVYIKEKKLNGRDFRFDVIALLRDQVEHIPNAFSSMSYSF